MGFHLGSILEGLALVESHRGSTLEGPAMLGSHLGSTPEGPTKWLGWWLGGTLLASLGYLPSPPSLGGIPVGSTAQRIPC